MSFISIVIINIYSIAILLVIGYHIIKVAEKGLVQDKLFIVILGLTILLLVLDIFSRFDGKADTFYTLVNNLSNFLMFMFGPVLPSLWLVYVYYHIFEEEGKLKPLLFSVFLLMLFYWCCRNLTGGIIILMQTISIIAGLFFLSLYS